MFLPKSLLSLLIAIVAKAAEVGAQEVIILSNNTLVCEGGICSDKRTIVTPVEEGVGSWTWTYDFVDGLGPDTELKVSVEVDETLTECSVFVNDESCNGCSLISCDWDGFGMNLGKGMAPLGVKYDCRNFEKGIGDFGKCYPLDPFVYPFERDSSVIQDDIVTGTEDEEESSSSDESEDSNLLEDLINSVTGSSAQHTVAVTNGMAMIIFLGTLLAF